MGKEKIFQCFGIGLIFVLMFSGVIFIPTYFMHKREDRQNLRNMPLTIKMLYYYDYIRQNLPRDISNQLLNTYIVLHDTGQYNYFESLDKKLGNIWQTDNSMTEFEAALNLLFTWSGLWKKNHTSHYLYNNLIGKITYYGDDIFVNGTDQYYDYAKSAVETIFSGYGDCEDHAILVATFLEAAGYETIMGVVHDNNQSGVKEDFHHGFLWVKVVNFSYPYLYADLWRFGEGEYEWLLLEPTDSVVYGSAVSWIAHYDINNFTRWEEIFHWKVVAHPDDSSAELNDLMPSHE
ncbi:MAG: transglutaminase domain-containing protein [Candidatus Heimdallarchaeota archaeon]|nr:transglutaminase domain-containing protein [Candidatus Heimdallarchaeota archaeon]